MHARVPVMATLTGAILLAFASSATAATSQYSLSQLTPFNGGAGSSAASINRAGQITGNIDGQAVIWSGSTLTYLNWGGAPTNGNAINDLGQVAGNAQFGSVSKATRWTGGQPSDLAPTGTDSMALGINHAGTVVGYASGSLPGQIATQAIVWSGAQATVLASLSGGKNTSEASAINNAGMIVGGSAVNSSGTMRHAVSWSAGAGTITDLGTLGGPNSWATAINDAGVIAGWASISGNLANHAVLWNGAALHDLGTGSMDSAIATGINNVGQTVGYTRNAASTIYHATLWNGDTAVDLNSYLSPELASEGWVLQRATGINDLGQIVGIASNDRFASQAFLLSPVPEADGYTMLLAGLGLVGWMARRRKAA